MKRILTYGLLTLAVVLIGLGAWLYLAPAYADRTRLSEDVVTRYHDLMLVPVCGGRSSPGWSSWCWKIRYLC